MKPVKNAVSMIRDNKGQINQVTTKRLPNWCVVCGHLGHVFKEHGDGIHPPSALVFKELRATWFMRVAEALEVDVVVEAAVGEGEDGDPALNSTYVDMTDPKRKRSERPEHDVSSNKAVAGNASTDGNQLAIIPLSASLSPPPKRDPKRNKDWSRWQGWQHTHS